MPPKKTITFADRIKAARAQAGLSQTQASRRWGFTLKTLQSWEQGIRFPAGLYAEKLEKVLRKIEG